MNSNQSVYKEIADIESAIESLRQDISAMTSDEKKVEVFYVEDDNVTEPTMVVYLPKANETTSVVNTIQTVQDVPRATAFNGSPNNTNAFPIGTFKGSIMTKVNNGNYRACFQDDGNFVVYDISGGKSVPRWSTATFNNSGAKLSVQSDGNIVIYNTSGRPIWSTGVFNFANSMNTWFYLESDGRMKVVTVKGSTKMLHWVSP